MKQEQGTYATVDVVVVRESGRDCRGETQSQFFLIEAIADREKEFSSHFRSANYRVHLHAPKSKGRLTLITSKPCLDLMDALKQFSQKGKCKPGKVTKKLTINRLGVLKLFVNDGQAIIVDPEPMLSGDDKQSWTHRSPVAFDGFQSSSAYPQSRRSD